jgi:uncharacterized protein
MRYQTRHIEKKILEFAANFKAILILGARQVGKSTLLSHLYPDLKMVVFDPFIDLHNARQDPDLFLNAFPAPLILDEVQYAPEVLGAIKRRMDLTDQKGQYFLTGSQNFSMLKNIAESMAGRVGIVTMGTMTSLEMLECGHEKGWLETYLNQPELLLKSPYDTFKAMNPHTQVIWRGSYPATLELANSMIPSFFESYMQTYVQKDIRSMENIQDLHEFDRFLGLLNMLTAQEINMSHLGREIGISPTTASRWINILKYTYQWLEIPPYHGNTIKRLSRKSKGYATDTGFACYKQRVSSPDALAISPQLGALFETWVVNDIYKQCSQLPVPPNCYHWRTSTGAEVDLILERDGCLYPIEIKCKTNPKRSDISGIKAFKSTYPKQKIMPGLVIHAGSERYLLDPDVIALPWNFHAKT